VFLTDIRDVIFQKNIFENLPNQYLYLFSEDSGITIKEDKHNSKWLTEAFNERLLKIIGDNPIICSGTLLGDVDNVIGFIRIMEREFNNIKETKPEIYKKNYFDQSIFNFIGYELAGSDLKIFPNGELVGTLCLSSLSKNAKDKIDIENNMVTVNGLYPAVIHQYDRNKKVTDFLIKKYQK
jgi:hypothetical protein